ncbi:TUBGCP6 family protein [Megaselia abdita]
MEEVGLTHLITDLCQQMCIKNEQDLKLVPALKRRSLEIILHWRNSDVKNSEFLIETEWQKIKQKDRSKILEDDFLKDEVILNAFTFFLALDKPKEDEQEIEESERITSLYRPGPFTLHDWKYNRKEQERIRNTENMFQAKPKFFKGIEKFNKDYEQDQVVPLLKEKRFMEFLKSPEMPEINEKFDNMFKPKMNELRLNSVSNRVLKKKPKDLEVKPIIQKTIPEKPPPKKVFSWNWENLANFGMVLEKSVISEVENSSIHLKVVSERFSNKKVPIKVVATKKLIDDLKLLSVGIQSELFSRNENFEFSMVEGITVPNVLPEVIDDFVQTFIECGTCYKKLSELILEKNYKYFMKGFMFKGLCSAIGDYLVIFREFVFHEQDTTLLSFYKRMKKMISQIINLAITCSVHPSSKRPLPFGSQILSHVYREIMRITEKDFIMVSVFILKRCCHVFFKHLENWIFSGVLEDVADELFICYVAHYRPNTKYFFDKAYFIRKESVPGFIQGHENDILQCGKYTMLLKALNPNHPIFKLKHPSIRVSLSFSDVEETEKQCREYFKECRELCGNPVSISKIYQDENHKNKEFIRSISERSKENMKRWNAEQEVLASIQAENRKKQYEELTNQLRENKIQKIAERQANIAAELKILREAEKKNDSFILIDNLNLQKRIEYYQELNDVLSKKLGLPIEETSSNPPTFRIDLDIEDGEDTPSVYTECMSLDSDFDRNANLNEVDKNRRHNMSSSNIRDIMGGSNKEDAQNANLELILEAQRIKKKILEHEHGIDSNSNPVKELTDLEKNRKKMMDGDTFAFVNLPQEKKLFTLDLTTERSRNKKRVLESEFDIIQGETTVISIDSTTERARNKKKMLGSDFDNKTLDVKIIDQTTERAQNRKKVLESDFDIIQPMSTTSDVSVIEKFANRNEEKEKPISSEEDLEKESLATTEEDVFEDAEDVLSEIDLNGNCVTPSDTTQSEFKTPTDTHAPPSPKKKNPYERCELLIKTNFKCAPKHSAFRLQLDPEDKPVKKTSSKALNCLSVITLTEFLQKSIVSPMSAQLEIVRNEVMRVFLEDHNLLKHFKSLRNYFFLMDGEFGSHICDGILDKLQNKLFSPRELLNCATLHSVLDNALSSSIGKDPNAQNLSFIILDTPEVFDLNSPSVLSNLTLCYSISWPLNLVFTNETLDKYSFIFKHLIKVRRISWLLEDAYHYLKMQVKEQGRDVLKSPEYRHVQLIRQKFSNFVFSLKNHITSTALQASWKFFKESLAHANCLEDIYFVHTQYIKRIEFLCMLNKKSVDFHNTMESIFKICLRFCRTLKSHNWTKAEDQQHFKHPRYNKLTTDEIEFEKFLKYTIYLGRKIVHHGYQEEIGEFINLINFNSYYFKENA